MEASEAKFSSIPGNVLRNVTIATKPSLPDDNTIFVLKETKKHTKHFLSLVPHLHMLHSNYLLAGWLAALLDI